MSLGSWTANRSTTHWQVLVIQLALLLGCHSVLANVLVNGDFEAPANVLSGQTPVGPGEAKLLIESAAISGYELQIHSIPNWINSYSNGVRDAGLRRVDFSGSGVSQYAFINNWEARLSQVATMSVSPNALYHATIDVGMDGASKGGRFQLWAGSPSAANPDVFESGSVLLGEVTVGSVGWNQFVPNVVVPQNQWTTVTIDYIAPNFGSVIGKPLTVSFLTSLLSVGPVYWDNATLTNPAYQVDGITVSPPSAQVYRGFTGQEAVVAQVQGVGPIAVTGSAIWSVDNPAVASVSATGLVTAQSVGSTIVRASFAGFEAQVPFDSLALPDLLATDRVSVDSSETQGDGLSANPSVSANGRLVVFESLSSNLVPGDTNGANDVFVRDQFLGSTSRASVASGGGQADGPSTIGSISADGRYVAFDSTASNLVAGDTNSAADVFVHDILFDQTERVSLATDGQEGNGASTLPAISADGRFVAFVSAASNLVLGDTNGARDVFVRDRQAGQTIRVHVASDGSQANGPITAGSIPSISASGRFVVFVSLATNLVANDLNSRADVFLRDVQTGTTERISVSSQGLEGNADSTSFRNTVSADGRFVVFQSNASNLVPDDTNGFARDCMLRDRQTGETTRINNSGGGVQDNGGVGSVTLSSDGRFVCFRSSGSNLVTGDTNGVDDVFVYDRLTSTLGRESTNFFGGQSNGSSQLTALSSDGRFLVFQSFATNLAPFDTNAAGDIFLRVRSLSGDLNCDGGTSVSDVPAFVDALIAPDTYAIAFPSCFVSGADINGDGSVDGGDIQPFVNLLLGS